MTFFSVMKNRILWEIKAEERTELQSWVRSHKLAHRYGKRAKEILLLSEGSTDDFSRPQAARGRAAISKGKNRFVERGIEGLKAEPRRGKPPGSPLADRARVIELACAKPDAGYRQWSQRRIAEQGGMSQSKGCDILGSNQLRPHNTD